MHPLAHAKDLSVIGYLSFYLAVLSRGAIEAAVSDTQPLACQLLRADMRSTLLRMSKGLPA